MTGLVLKAACGMEPVKVLVPNFLDVIDIILFGMVDDYQTEFACQLAFLDSHFPEISFLLVVPFQSDATELL